MNKPMLPGGKRIVAALAVVMATLWALLRFGGKPPEAPTPVAAPAPAPRLEATVPIPKSRKSTASAPTAPVKVRGAGLRDKGEALGGTPP